MNGNKSEWYLSLYCELKITKTELQQAIGGDLHNVECQTVCSIKRGDVINAIQLMQSGTISKQILVEWVNTVWFTDLFVFDDGEADSIVSVLEVLETLDEEDAVIADGEFAEMILALEKNEEYNR